MNAYKEEIKKEATKMVENIEERCKNEK